MRRTHVRDFARQLTTLLVRNAATAVSFAQMLGELGRLFAGRGLGALRGALATIPVARRRMSGQLWGRWG